MKHALLKSISKIISNTAPPLNNFLTYAIIGASGAIIDYSIFFILTSNFTISIYLANAISVISGITNNFTLNRRYNFKVDDLILVRFLSFFSVGLLGLGISQLAIFGLNTKLGIDIRLAKITSMLIVVAVQFTLNTKVTFRKT